MADYYREIDVANLWPIICQEAQLAAKSTPLLADFLQRHLLQYDNFAAALCYVLAEKLADSDTNIPQWQAYLIELLNAQTQQAQQHKS